MRICWCIGAAELLAYRLADCGMDFFNIIGCRRTSRPYRPNRLIGNYRILRRGNVRNGTVNLRRADIYGMTSITLRLGFADTDNNFQPGINRCLGFFLTSSSLS